MSANVLYDSFSIFSGFALLPSSPNSTLGFTLLKIASWFNFKGELGMLVQTRPPGFPKKAPFLTGIILPDPTQSPWLSV